MLAYCKIASIEYYMERIEDKDCSRLQPNVLETKSYYTISYEYTLDVSSKTGLVRSEIIYGKINDVLVYINFVIIVIADWSSDVLMN